MKKIHSSYDLKISLHAFIQKLKQLEKELEKDIAETSAFEKETLKEEVKKSIQEIYANAHSSLSQYNIRQLAQKIFKNEKAKNYMNKIAAHLEEGVHFLKSQNDVLQQQKQTLKRSYDQHFLSKKQTLTQLKSVEKNLQPIEEKFNTLETMLNQKSQSLNIDPVLLPTFANFSLVESNLSLSALSLSQLKGIRKFYHLNLVAQSQNNKDFLFFLDKNLHNQKKNPQNLSAPTFLGLYEKAKKSRILDTFQLYEEQKVIKEKLSQQHLLTKNKFESQNVRFQKTQKAIAEIDTEIQNNKNIFKDYEELSPEEKIQKVLKIVLPEDLSSLSQAPNAFDFLLSISNQESQVKAISTLIAKHTALAGIAEKLEEENIEKMRFLSSTQNFRQTLEKTVEKLYKLLGDSQITFDLELIAQNVVKIEEHINTISLISQKKIEAVLSQFSASYSKNFEWDFYAQSQTAPALTAPNYDTISQITKNQFLKSNTGITSSVIGLVSSVMFFDMITSILENDTSLSSLFTNENDKNLDLDFSSFEQILPQVNNYLSQADQTITQVAHQQIYEAESVATPSHSVSDVSSSDDSDFFSACSSGPPSLW